MGVNYIFATGLKHCYDEQGQRIECLHSGQDAEYQIGLSKKDRFKEYKQKGVLDSLTNLIFPKKFNFFEFPRTWEEAFVLVEKLNKEKFLGLNSWRIPNKRELKSIFSYARIKPALSSSHLFEDTTLGWYWTSTTVAKEENYAWAIHLEGSRMFYGRKDQYYLVVPVAGKSKNLLSTGQKKSFRNYDDGYFQFGKSLDNRFLKLEDGILDKNTNLVWFKKGFLKENVNWNYAYKLIKELNRKSKFTWRLPNINELESIVNSYYMYPAIEDSIFKETKEVYLSSTTSVFEPSYAFVLYLNKGAIGVGRKEQKIYSILPVRENF